MPNANTARWNRIASTFCGQLPAIRPPFGPDSASTFLGSCIFTWTGNFSTPCGCCCFWAWPAARAGPGPRRLTLGLLLLLFLSSTITILCFHIDYRYLVASLPSLVLLLCGGVTSFGNRVHRIFGRGKPAISVACLLLLGWRSGEASYRQFLADMNRPDHHAGIRTEEFARDLAQHFDRVVDPQRPTALLVRP